MEPFFTKRANEHLMLAAIVIKGLVICNVDQNVTQKNPQWYVMTMWSTRKHKITRYFENK